MSKNYQKLEDVIGCKWSVSVLLAIEAGINRPGMLERHIDGISAKCYQSVCVNSQCMVY